VKACERARRLAFGTLAFVLGACGQGGLASSETYSPPPPLALVAILDPSSSSLTDQFHQLEDVIRAQATPGEAVVVMYMQPSYGKTYTVRSGDSLSSIAAAHSMTLDALEGANPQLGPVSGRNWKLIHPGERVMLPDGSTNGALVLVSRAPAGPKPPELVRLPNRPSNPTDYQRAQYQRTVASDTATNDARVASWRAEAAAALQPWQQDVVAQLEKRAGTTVAGSRAPDGPMVSASVVAGVTTLQGLTGRRTLLMLGGGDSGPGTLTPRSLSQVNLVVANLEKPASASAWTAAATNAGAQSVTALDVALTRLQLAQLVNHQD
jgi:LysM repeat protein